MAIDSTRSVKGGSQEKPGLELGAAEEKVKNVLSSGRCSISPFLKKNLILSELGVGLAPFCYLLLGRGGSEIRDQRAGGAVEG